MVAMVTDLCCHLTGAFLKNYSLLKETFANIKDQNQSAASVQGLPICKRQTGKSPLNKTLKKKLDQTPLYYKWTTNL